MGIADKHLLDPVFFLGLVRRDAEAAAILRLVFGHGDTLDIALVGHGNDDVFSDDQVFDVDVAGVKTEFAPSRHAVIAVDLHQLVADDGADSLRFFQNILQIGNSRFQFEKFVLELVDFQSGQTHHSHIQYGVGLFFRQ